MPIVAVWKMANGRVMVEQAMDKYPLHEEAGVFVHATPDQVFAVIDDHSQLASHMSESSWMMGGGSMQVSVDESMGKAVGSHIRLAGKVCGIDMHVDEIVTERNPPLCKVWETTGKPELLVIGNYRMGFQLAPEGAGSHLNVFIDYELPEQGIGRWLGRWFGGWYARWCTRQMAEDAASKWNQSINQNEVRS